MSSDGWKEAGFMLSVCSAVVSVASALIARAALANSTRAVTLAETKHQWEEDDRSSAAAERAWCERVRLRLEESPDDPIGVPDDKLDWALRGDGKYFQVVRHGNLTFTCALGVHAGPLLG